MSYNIGIRPFPGNLDNDVAGRDRQTHFLGKRRLVEECEKISIYAVQRAFGKKALLEAIRQARPFRLPVLGGYFDIDLTYEAHRLPGRLERYASLEDGTARLWLVCPSCWGKIAKLYYFYFFPSLERSSLLCRRCHRLTYLCSNCGGNRWYKEIARPIKKLLTEKERFLARRPRPSVQARLAQLDEQAQRLKHRLKPKSQRQRKRSRAVTSKRRPYRDYSLIEGLGFDV